MFGYAGIKKIENRKKKKELGKTADMVTMVRMQM
jgi:hypothetical protein